MTETSMNPEIAYLRLSKKIGPPPKIHGKGANVQYEGTGHLLRVVHCDIKPNGQNSDASGELYFHAGQVRAFYRNFAIELMHSGTYKEIIEATFKPHPREEGRFVITSIKRAAPELHRDQQFLELVEGVENKPKELDYDLLEEAKPSGDVPAPGEKWPGAPFKEWALRYKQAWFEENQPKKRVCQKVAREYSVDAQETPDMWENMNALNALGEATRAQLMLDREKAERLKKIEDNAANISSKAKVKTPKPETDDDGGKE